MLDITQMNFINEQWSRWVNERNPHDWDTDENWVWHQSCISIFEFWLAESNNSLFWEKIVDGVMHSAKAHNRPATDRVMVEKILNSMLKARDKNKVLRRNDGRGFTTYELNYFYGDES